jgi:hypothetical protein
MPDLEIDIDYSPCLPGCSNNTVDYCREGGQITGDFKFTT